MSEQNETPMSFETALTRLEEIVMRLEGGQLTLEDSLKQFEEATKLSDYCKRKLSAIEEKIEKITPNQAGISQP